MSKYTFEDMHVVIKLIDKFNKNHGRNKNGIPYEFINNHLLGATQYKGLISYIKKHIDDPDHTDSDIRRNKKGKYGDLDIHNIVTSISEILEIPKKEIKENNLEFEISFNVVKALRNLYRKGENSTNLLYFVGSTYQGRQLKVAPRSIFIIDLKAKKVTFEYYGDNSLVAIQSFIGTIHGEHLVYMDFKETPKSPNTKMYILKKGPLPWNKIRYIQGTYVGDDGTSPMAGTIFCEKVDNIEAARAKLHVLLETGIQYRLLYSQVRGHDNAITKEQLSNHHFNIAAEEINSYFKGTYYGCFLSSQNMHSIFSAKLELNIDGSAVFYWHHNNKGEKGWIYISGNRKKIFLRFKYNEKLSIFKYFITLTHDGIRFYGSYGGGSNLPSLPETGRIIFFKVEDKNTHNIPIRRINVQDKTKLKDFLENPTFSTLHYEAIDFLSGGDIKNRENDFSDTPSSIFKGTKFNPINEVIHKPNHPKNQSIPTQYLGIYQGYIVHYFDEYPNYRIQKIGLEIKKNKIVVASSKNRKYNGQAIYYATDEKLSFHLAFNEEYPEIHHILEITRWETYDDLILRGTYTGTGRTAQKSPIGGRIIFFKESTRNTIEDISVKDFNLSNPNDIQELEKKQPGLIDFFLGTKDNMTEGYSLFKESQLLPISNTPIEKIENQVSGYYLSFRIRTDLKTISVVPLYIDTRGNVKMKSTRKLKKNEFEEYSGICEINNGEVLSLQFHSYGSQPLSAQSKFNKSARIIDIEKNNILMGVFSSSNSEYRRPFSCKQILIFQGKDISKYEKTLPEIIPINPYPKAPSNKFVYYNANYQNIMEYLVGAEYNMIRMSRGPKITSVRDNKGFKKKINYGEVFFIAALKYFDLGKKKIAKKMWKHAIQNGFKEDALINKLKTKHSDAWHFFNK